jgi:peptidase E/acetyl esterase/lipase
MCRSLLPRFLLTVLAATMVAAPSHGQESQPTRRILAIGGGTYWNPTPSGPPFCKYMLALTGKKDPVIVLLPTAGGDSDRSIVQWYDVMSPLGCRPRHLRLFSDSYKMTNLEERLLSADAIFVGGGNTMNMLAVWKAHGIDKILRKAWERGILLAGESAGMICWFEQGITDSRADKLSPLECLGFLKGSACPHFMYETKRRPAYTKMLLAGEVKDGFACDDGAALLFEGDQLARVVSIYPEPKAYRLRRQGDGVAEEPIKAELLTGTPKPMIVDIWPGKPADDVGIKGDEYFRDLIVNGKPYQVDGKPTKWLTNVTKPTLTIYRPEKAKDTGTAVLIAPGGGYHNLGWDVEGEEIAAWLNSIGVTGIILKYRCPRRPGDEKGVPPAGPLKDAQRAISVVRSKAADWGIDPKRIGMVGFSAGGHLVGSTCTNFEKRTYGAIDAIDQVSCRPDFGIMCYSGYFKVGDGLTPTVKTPKDCPPLFFVHATDDAISDAEHSVAFYLALKRAKINTEMQLFEHGGHGFGVRPGSPCHGWTRTCVDWMRGHGFLKR